MRRPRGRAAAVRRLHARKVAAAFDRDHRCARRARCARRGDRSVGGRCGSRCGGGGGRHSRAGNRIAGSLLAELWPIVRAAFEVAGRRAASVPPECDARGDVARRAAAPRARRLGRRACLRAAGSRNTRGPGAVREETPLFDWVGRDRPARRQPGARRTAGHGYSSTATSRRFAPGTRTSSAGWRCTVCPMSVCTMPARASMAALLAVHRDPRGRWILQKGSRDDLREHAVSGHWRGEVVRAVFDRSFVDEHGVRWVIDYKTSQHVGGGLEEFLEREVERYRPQLQRYAMLAQSGPEPVRVGLYFPLMRAWREWALEPDKSTRRRWAHEPGSAEAESRPGTG